MPLKGCYLLFGANQGFLRPGYYTPEPQNLRVTTEITDPGSYTRFTTEPGPYEVNDFESSILNRRFFNRSAASKLGQLF
jgi:hypothetical protein